MKIVLCFALWCAAATGTIVLLCYSFGIKIGEEIDDFEMGLIGLCWPIVLPLTLIAIVMRAIVTLSTGWVCALREGKFRRNMKK